MVLVDLLREQYGYLDVALVPNGVDLAQFDVPERLKQPVPTVGMLYHSASWKGCDICLEAVAIARKIIPQLRLVAFGHQPPAENLPLPSNTEFTCLPPQTLLKTIYAQCDAWLFGSRVEGFGLPILEAMACRTPVIVTPAGAAPELIAQGGGILVPPESPQAMADAIITICQMAQWDWLNLSAQAYACALNYDVNQACRQFESVLKQIYAQTRQPARATP